jgi:hypothetical protein
MDVVYLLLRNMHTLLLHPFVLPRPIPTLYLAILTFAQRNCSLGCCTAAASVLTLRMGASYGRLR